MRCHQADEAAQLADLARGLAQAGRMIFGIFSLSIVSRAPSNWRWSIWLMGLLYAAALKAL
jgi:hypothetical protein